MEMKQLVRETGEVVVKPYPRLTPPNPVPETVRLGRSVGVLLKAPGEAPLRGRQSFRLRLPCRTRQTNRKLAQRFVHENCSSTPAEGLARTSGISKPPLKLIGQEQPELRLVSGRETNTGD